MKNIFLLYNRCQNTKILFEKYKLNLEKIIIFALVAFGPSKMWPVEKFRELVKIK